jgi:hypothetical protein
MSPTLELDVPEIFSDWSECNKPPCAPTDDVLAEYVRSRQQCKAEADEKCPDAADYQDLAGMVSLDKYSRILIAKVRPSSANSGLRRVLGKARELTNLADDWDGEGSQGYSTDTLRRVRRFLLAQSFLCKRFFQITLPTPQINPADQGSVDVFWRLPGRQLLLNFPKDEGSPITYYGRDDEGKNTVTGRTAVDELRPDLVAWLTQTMK